jgi:hypothetical protein
VPYLTLLCLCVNSSVVRQHVLLKEHVLLSEHVLVRVLCVPYLTLLCLCVSTLLCLCVFLNSSVVREHVLVREHIRVLVLGVSERVGVGQRVVLCVYGLGLAKP